METIQWKVEGMTCANCALSVNKYLDKQGMQNIRVNPIDGDVSFEMVEGTDTKEIVKGIEGLGYQVNKGEEVKQSKRNNFLSTQNGKLLFCLPFTLVLMLHMFERAQTCATSRPG